MTVFYLGPEASHHGSAARTLFVEKEVKLVPLQNFSDVFLALENDPATEARALVAIENSIGGDVQENLNRLFSTKYQIEQEIFLEIEHCLMIQANSDWSQIKKIYLHPQVRLQCSKFLEANPQLEQVIVSSTAKGAELAANDESGDSCTIAATQAATHNGLKIIKSGLGDYKPSLTRFLQLKLSSQAIDLIKTGTKNTLVFELIDEPGALAKVLDLLALKGANMTKIESQPIPSIPWNYRYYIDFIADNEEFGLNEFNQITTKVYLLGSYKRGTIATENK
ncbi:MAG: prephenate dehydratase [Patescibacteria group bacterium]